MAALKINEQASALMEQKGLRMTDDIKLACSIFLVSDLAEVGNAGAEWEDPVDEEEIKLIYQDTLQDYIHQGLKNGTIDPVELQQSTEPLLSKQQQQLGSQAAERSGVPLAPTQQQMMASHRGGIQ